MRAASLRPAGVRARAGLRSAVVVAALLGAATGCAHTSPDAAASHSPSSAAPVPSPSATTVDEQAALLAQYRKFWTSLAPVSRLAAAARRPALSALAVDPALQSLLTGMAANDASGEVFYGAHQPDPQRTGISPDGKTALVDDCQDSTRTGLADRRTLKPKTRGVARNHVDVTMKKAGDGLWKVAFIAYTKTPC